MKRSTNHQIRFRDRVIDYRVVRSKAARKLRVRVGPAGVEVVQPISRHDDDVPKFLTANAPWIVEQLDRAHRLRLV